VLEIIRTSRNEGSLPVISWIVRYGERAIYEMTQKKSRNNQPFPQSSNK